MKLRLDRVLAHTERESGTHRLRVSADMTALGSGTLDRVEMRAIVCDAAGLPVQHKERCHDDLYLEDGDSVSLRLRGRTRQYPSIAVSGDQRLDLTVVGYMRESTPLGTPPVPSNVGELVGGVCETEIGGGVLLISWSVSRGPVDADGDSKLEVLLLTHNASSHPRTIRIRQRVLGPGQREWDSSDSEDLVLAGQSSVIRGVIHPRASHLKKASLEVAVDVLSAVTDACERGVVVTCPP